jgi:hypothetical protein
VQAARPQILIDHLARNSLAAATVAGWQLHAGCNPCSQKLQVQASQSRLLQDWGCVTNSCRCRSRRCTRSCCHCCLTVNREAGGLVDAPVQLCFCGCLRDWIKLRLLQHTARGPSSTGSKRQLAAPKVPTVNVDWQRHAGPATVHLQGRCF